MPLLIGASATLALSGLLYVLAPALTPFLVGAMLAYAANPLVDQLVHWRVPRALAAALVLACAMLVISALFLMLAPLIRDEAMRIAERLPGGIRQFNTVIGPWAERLFGTPWALDENNLQQLLTDNRDIVSTVVQRTINSVRIGGIALAGLVVNALLAPVVTYYLLLDWHKLTQRLDDLIPRRLHAKVRAVAGDINTVLAAYLRGQLLVMGILAAYYALALGIAGLPSAIAIGLLTGSLIFIPYIGFATSFLLALIVAVLQFGGWTPILWVLCIYGLGQLLESFLLTPYLVGERVGLPPLAVIFALMAFGQVFGFFGVLLALPASAAIMVGLRELHAAYLRSHAYLGKS